MNTDRNTKIHFSDLIRGFLGIPTDKKCFDYYNHLSYLSRALTTALLLLMCLMVVLMLLFHEPGPISTCFLLLLLSAVAIILIQQPGNKGRIDGYFSLYIHSRRVDNSELLIIPLLHQDSDKDGEYMYRALSISCLAGRKDRTCFVFAMSVLQEAYLYLECIYQFDEDVSAAFHEAELVSEYVSILDTLTLYISTQNGENVDMSFLKDIDNRIKALIAICEKTDGFVRTDLEERFLSDKNI